MELKAAMEAATAELDVRPGFVGDVMAGARRRHTRKLLAITAAVALLAGVTTGVVLTHSPTVQPLAEDTRLTAAATGDLAGDTEFIKQSLAVWNRAAAAEQVTQVSPDAHVFWAANTPAGPASLIVQSVLVRSVAGPQTLVGLVHGGVVVDQEVVYQGGGERGIYRLGDDDATYVVLGLGERIFWSANPVRGPDLKYSRTWQAAELRDGVAVVKTKLAEKPVFVRMSSPPAADDFTRFQERISPRQEIGQQKALEPYPVLGWTGVMWATPEPAPSKSMPDDLTRRGYRDYGPQFATSSWEVRAWLPDGRYVVVSESSGELIGALYQADGTFDRVVAGGPLVRGKRVPVRLALPDGQGTILAERNSLLGPDEREGAWLAPAGTTEVTIWRTGSPEVIPL